MSVRSIAKLTDVTAPLDVRPRSTTDRERCPYCHDELGPATALAWTCPECATRAHADCATMHGGCALLGCDGSVRPRALPARVVARSRRSRFGRLVLAPIDRAIERDRAALRRLEPVAIAGLVTLVQFAAWGAAVLAFALVPTPSAENLGNHHHIDQMTVGLGFVGFSGFAIGCVAAVVVFCCLFFAALRATGRMLGANE